MVWKFSKVPFQHNSSLAFSVKLTWFSCRRCGVDVVGKEVDVVTFKLTFGVSFGELVTSDWRGFVAFTEVVKSISSAFIVSQFNSVPPAAFQALYFSINRGSKRDTRYWILITVRWICTSCFKSKKKKKKKISDKDLWVKVPNYIMNEPSQMCISFEIRVHYWSNPVIFWLYSSGALGPLMSIENVYHITNNYICLIHFLLKGHS